MWGLKAGCGRRESLAVRVQTWGRGGCVGAKGPWEAGQLHPPGLALVGGRKGVWGLKAACGRRAPTERRGGPEGLLWLWRTAGSESTTAGPGEVGRGALRGGSLLGQAVQGAGRKVLVGAAAVRRALCRPPAWLARGPLPLSLHRHRCHRRRRHRHIHYHHHPPIPLVKYPLCPAGTTPL